MKILITGATGYIGSAVAKAAQAAGHSIVALAHSDNSEAVLRERGWTTVRGDLQETKPLESLAGECDAVIHAANTGGEDAGRVDMEAARAVLRGLGDSGNPFVYTSGVWVLGSGAADEQTTLNPSPIVAWRPEVEQTVLGAAPGVRSVVVRPGIVYGNGGGIPGMVWRGDLPVVGAGTQRWPLVHLDDLARLYVRALDAPAGSVLHGTSESLTMRDIALLAQVKHGSTPKSVSLDDARSRMGPFADALALDQTVSSLRTRELTGWTPHGPSPVEEFLAGSYAHTDAHSK